MTRWLQLRHWIRILDAEAIQVLIRNMVWRRTFDAFPAIVRCRYLFASKQFDVLRAKLNNLDPLLDSTLEIQQCKVTLLL